MDTDVHKFEIQTVRDRNAHLSLTFEQAEKIWRYEEDKFRGRNSPMSMWEELDYELHVYSHILDTEQLIIYEKQRSKIIELNVTSFTEQDEWGIIGIKKAEDTLKFYEVLVPAFFSDLYTFSLGWLTTGEDTKTKLDFLTAEYQRFLFDQKKWIVSEHLRNYRTYKPKTLDSLLLGHKLNCIWPDSYGFIQKMDEPAKAVFEFLKQKVSVYIYQKEAFVDDRLKELRAFQENNFKKYHREIPGWSVWERSFMPAEQYDQRVMLILLLKFNGYDY